MRPDEQGEKYVTGRSIPSFQRLDHTSPVNLLIAHQFQAHNTQFYILECKIAKKDVRNQEVTNVLVAGSQKEGPIG
jgi:hypothetical protein